MTDARRVFELLDVPKFAYPSLSELDPVQTAYNIRERLNGRSFMSYTQPLSLVPRIVRNEITPVQIAKLSSYSDEWKNVNVREVAMALYNEFGGKGVWYPVPARPTQVFEGLWFKPSVRGVWFDGKRPYMIGINPRKHQGLVSDHITFLARGMYELYGVDDPNDPVPLILDLSIDQKSATRIVRKSIITEPSMSSVGQFEETMRAFFEALRIAGVESVPKDMGDIRDLFRKGRP